MADYTVDNILIEECKRPMFKTALLSYAKAFSEGKKNKEEETKNA